MMRKWPCLMLIAGLLLCLAGCSGVDISKYADTPILVTGLLEEDFYITPGELAALECVEATAVGKTAKAGTVKAYGPTLDTFLAQYDKTKDEFKSIRFTASDDYVVNIGRASWDRYQVILSVGPLEEYQWPLRVVIPGGDSGNWIRSVTTIEFTYAKEG